MGFEISPQMSKEIATRVAVEGRIARKVIKIALQQSCLISVHDGEEITVRKSKDAKAIEAAMFTTDEDFLIIHDKDGKRIGQINFVYGNDGWDVISDYSTFLDIPIMEEVNAWIEKNECF